VVQLVVGTDEVHVRLSRGEKIGGLHGDLTVPLSQVRDVEAVAEPYRFVRGIRAPGLGVPGRTKIGTWRSQGRKTFAVARHGKPGVRIRLQDNTFDQIVLSVPDGPGLVAAVRKAAGAARGSDQERHVTFRSAEVDLAGLLLLPPTGQQVRAAAVIIAGSGPIDRDGNAPRAPLSVSRNLATALAGSGIATLRYDKRGVGASGGDFLRASLSDNIDDARAALAAIADDTACVGVPLFVIGHSEGASIATVLGAESNSPTDSAGPPLSGVVLLAGQTKTGEQTLRYQAAMIGPTLPTPVKAIMRLLRTDVTRQQAKALEKLKASSAEVVRMNGARTNAKWMREFMALDPTAYLTRIIVPVLAITGDKDLQVDPADLDTMTNIVPGPITAIRVPDLTHILRRDAGSPTLKSYRSQWQQPVDQQVLTDVRDWILGLAPEGAPSH
jgi:hypothetical protein